jgi:hypothetical protein
MAEQIEALPAERIGHVEHVADVLPDVVAGIGGPMLAEAMACRIERDQVAAAEQRCKQIEAAGIVEPAVQSDDGPAFGVAPLARGQRERRQLEAALDGRRSVAGPPAYSCRPRDRRRLTGPAARYSGGWLSCR